jgi:hypothetical protein
MSLTVSVTVTIKLKIFCIDILDTNKLLKIFHVLALKCTTVTVTDPVPFHQYSKVTGMVPFVKRGWKVKF